MNMHLLLRETIQKIILELNPAYEKHRVNQEKLRHLYRQKYGKEPEDRPENPNQEKEKLFFDVVKYLDKFINLTDNRKRVIWSKISGLSKNSEYWMKSYMKMGDRGWQDVKEFVLPGFQI